MKVGFLPSTTHTLWLKGQMHPELLCAQMKSSGSHRSLLYLCWVSDLLAIQWKACSCFHHSIKEREREAQSIFVSRQTTQRITISVYIVLSSVQSTPRVLSCLSYTNPVRSVSASPMLQIQGWRWVWGFSNANKWVHARGGCEPGTSVFLVLYLSSPANVITHWNSLSFYMLELLKEGKHI